MGINEGALRLAELVDAIQAVAEWMEDQDEITTDAEFLRESIRGLSRDQATQRWGTDGGLVWDALGTPEWDQAVEAAGLPS